MYLIFEKCQPGIVISMFLEFCQILGLRFL